MIVIVSSQIRILLLEDQPVDAELLERELRRSKLDFSVRRVDSQAGFREQLLTYDPDIVLSDYHVPGFDGLEALEITRESAPDAPFIFVSGSIGEEHAIETLKKGAADYVIKDRLSRIGSVVERALAEAKTRAAGRRDAAALEYRAQFEHLMTTISTELINLASDEIDSAIEAALARLGAFVGVDRAFVALLRDDGVTLDNSHQWVAQGLGSDRERLRGVSTSDFVWMMSYLRRGEAVHIPRIADLPPEATNEKRMLERLGCVSHLSVPMSLGGTLVGFLGFESSHREMSWAEDSIGLLRIAGAAFANAIGRKRQEERLANALRRTQLLLDSVAEGIVGFDLRGHVLFVNPAASRITGYQAGEMIGRHLHSMIHHRRADGSPYPFQECPLYQTLRDGKTRAKSREVFVRKDGQSVPVEFTCSPMIDRDVIVGAVEIFADVSQQLLLEEQFEREKRLSSLGRLAATIAHEINNVLMGIQPFAELIGKIEPTNERIEKAVGRITAAVQRGKDITAQILRFTRASPPIKRRIEIAPWLQEFVNEMRGVIRNEITIWAETPESPPAILADRTHLHQIFSNLILNARDAISGPGTIRIHLDVPQPNSIYPFGVVAHPERLAHFLVIDSGSGMRAEVLSQIFEPLFTTKQRGNGLGLSVTHQSVIANGGQIFVESAIGEGTTFHVFLERAEPNDIPAATT